jgi:membrane-associated phospholipid phosphatase
MESQSNRVHAARAAVGSLLLVFALLCSGCGTLPSGQRWGERAIYPFDWSRIPRSARSAALDPITWGSLGGAAVIAGGNWDRDISDWATEHTPMFGSIGGAQNYSDNARLVLQVEALASGLVTPGGSDKGGWLLSKGRGMLVELGAFGVTTGLTSGLKEAIGRERPDRSDDLSMPSGHASSAFGAMAVANQNLDYIDMNPYARTGLKATNVALAASVGWARVEGQKHYPTDVLVGAALGNFTTRFIYEAFIGTHLGDRFSVYVEPNPRGGQVALGWSF